MNRCNVCGKQQIKIGTWTIIVGEQESVSPMYNIDLLTFIKGKHICNKCMDVYSELPLPQRVVDSKV